MSLDSCRKKTLLYSDLFKCQTNIVPEKEEGEISKVESWNSGSNQSSSPSGSSSSGFSTTFCSSSESDDGDVDFTAELTRQMAEYMLQEEEEEEDNTFIVEKASSRVKNNRGIYSRPVVSVDDPSPPVQLKNQNQMAVRKQGRSVSVGRRVNGSKSAEKTEGVHHREKRERGMLGHHHSGINGSGMQAVFLGNGSPAGTGVFLPRLTSDPTEIRNKKSGNCSIVLMPTRVLQALELHFKQRQHFTISGGSLIHSGPKDESIISNGDSQLENRTPNCDEMQLPQEWTY